MTAPERIWATCNGSDPSGNWWHCRELGVGTEYILHTRAALAASPLVQEIVADAVRAEREACAAIADESSEMDDDGGEMFSDEYFIGNAVSATACDIAAAIRARGEG